MSYKITQIGYEKLIQQKKRISEDLTKQKNELKKFKEMGDLRENEAYKVCQQQINALNMQLVQIEENLKNVVVVEENNLNKDTVSFGSSVILYKNNIKKPLNYKICGSYEANPLEGLISDDSLLGSELLGKQVGDVIEINMNNNKSNTFEIIKIS